MENLVEQRSDQRSTDQRKPLSAADDPAVGDAPPAFLLVNPKAPIILPWHLDI